MFHEASPRLRAWLAAFAGPRPELRDEHEDAARRLRAALDGSESDRAARLAIILELRGHLADREADVADRDAEVAAQRQALEKVERAYAASERDRAARLEVIRELEDELAANRTAAAALAAERQRLDDELVRARADLERLAAEAEAWIRVAPGVRWRVPGGRAAAARLRRLKARLLGRS